MRRQSRIQSNNMQNHTNLLLFFWHYINFIKNTQLSQNMEDVQRNSAFHKIDLENTDSSNSDLNNLGFANSMIRVISAQNGLIVKLLQRQSVLSEELSKRLSYGNSSSGSDNKPETIRQVSAYREFNQRERNSSGQAGECDPYITKNSVKIIQKQVSIFAQEKIVKKNDFEEQSNSSLFQQQLNNENKQVKPCLKKKQTETKNMVKNFAKAIFSYIKKNMQKTSRVLRYLGISEQEFMKVFDQLRGHVHSISQLRNLWVPEGNIYHKAFRILSCDYLRKKCVERTFNSRTQNFMVHLKYRQRLLQGIKSPEQFTVLKTS